MKTDILTTTTTTEITQGLVELRLEIEPLGLDVALALADVCEKLKLTDNQTQDVLGPSLYHLITGEPVPVLTHLIDWTKIRATDFTCPKCNKPLTSTDNGLWCKPCDRTWVPVPRDLLGLEEKAEKEETHV